MSQCNKPAQKFSNIKYSYLNTASSRTSKPIYDIQNIKPHKLNLIDKANDPSDLVNAKELILNTILSNGITNTTSNTTHTYTHNKEKKKNKK